MVDTSLFSAEFQAQLLKKISDLDSETDGLLIHGDNFQALRLISTRGHNQIQSVYIDPPYNTNASAIAYKNGFKDSSWLSLIENRLSAAKSLLTSSSLVCVAIDDVEAANLKLCLSQIFHEILGVAAIRSN